MQRDFDIIGRASYYAYERCSTGVRVVVVCSRCCREHEAIEATKQKAIYAADRKNMSCQCFQEEPPLFAVLFGKLLTALGKLFDKLSKLFDDLSSGKQRN